MILASIFNNSSYDDLILLFILCIISVFIAIQFKITDFVILLLFFSLILIYLYAWGVLSKYYSAIGFIVLSLTLYITTKQNRKVSNVE